MSVASCHSLLLAGNGGISLALINAELLLSTFRSYCPPASSSVFRSLTPNG